MHGGDGQLAAQPMGLRQLDSPPVSLKALIDWFLAPTMQPESVGFSNTTAPLGSIHALASANSPVSINTPNGLINLDPANMANVESAFASWLAALKRNDLNIGVFYFCGHGFMVSDHFLLAEDFGSNDLQPWAKAFNITNTIRGVEREVKGALYFFLDACREVSRELALSIGGNPNALLDANVTKKMSRSSLVRISATGEGQLAFAPLGGEKSYFTNALIRALSGFAGTKSAGQPLWEVDGETLASAIRKILEYDWKKKTAPVQVCEQLIHGRSIPLVRMQAAPKVAVEINYLPENLRAQYEIYLKSSQSKFLQSKQDKCLEAEVPMGIYTVGAEDPNGELQPDIRHDEELRPPLYTLELGTQL